MISNKGTNGGSLYASISSQLGNNIDVDNCSFNSNTGESLGGALYIKNFQNLNIKASNFSYNSG